MNFTSQFCTSRFQSERLLALGLNKETADMHYYHTVDFEYNEVWSPSVIPYNNILFNAEFVGELNMIENYIIPAWSLHRLLEMMPKIIRKDLIQWYLSITPYYNDMVSYEYCGDMESRYLYKSGYNDIYTNIINCIEWLITEGHFNKEYLE